MDTVWILGLLGMSATAAVAELLGLPGTDAVLLAITAVVLAALLAPAVWGYRRAGRLRLAWILPMRPLILLVAVVLASPLAATLALFAACSSGCGQW